MQPLISIIVPVYKVEKYLPRCLDSLCRQSLKDIEILLIDDASPDCCGTICEEYAAKDKRFKAFHHTENKGLSAARNTGIRQATADYLMFVDSDDWVHEDFCKVPYECAIRNNADLVMFGFRQIMDKSPYHKQKEFTETVADGFVSHNDAIDLTFKVFGMVTWNKLYHKNLFKDFLFPAGQVYEDTATTYKLIWKSSRIYCTEKILYYYSWRSESITGHVATRTTVREQFKVCWQQCFDLTRWGFQSESLDLFKTNIALNYCMKTPINFTDSYYASAAEVIRSIKKAPQGLTWKRKFMIKLFQWHPSLFNLACILCNKQVP